MGGLHIDDQAVADNEDFSGFLQLPANWLQKKGEKIARQLIAKKERKNCPPTDCKKRERKIARQLITKKEREKLPANWLQKKEEKKKDFF